MYNCTIGTIDVSKISSTKYLYYGIIPDVTSGGCAGGCGFSFNALDNFSSVASHELVEAITDPAVGVVEGDTPVAPLGWYDPQGNNGEISDICNAQQATVVGANGKKVVVQKHWSNADNACIAQPRK